MADYYTEVMADSPIAFWKMDETSGNIADSSGSGYTGTVNSTPNYQCLYARDSTYPNLQGGIFFHGTSQFSDYFTVNDAVPLRLGTTAFTIACWYRLDPGAGMATAFPNIAEKGNSAVAGWSLYATEFSTSGRGRIGFKNTNLDNQSSIIDNWTVGEWGYIAYAWASASDGRFYHNGVDVGTVAGRAYNSTDTGTLLIGTGDNQCGPGYLGGFAIFSTKLSQARIQAHYDGGRLATFPQPPLVMDQKLALKSHRQVRR